MPRVRWAQKCRARRDGKACRAWSVRGAYVCAVHGGRAPKVRNNARVRLLQLVMEREFRRDMADWHRRRIDFEVYRIMLTASLLGMDPEKVDRWDIVHCHALHGRPPLSDQAPQPVWRRDGRLRRFYDNPR